MSARLAGTTAALVACALAQAAPPDMSGYWKVDRYIEEVRTLDGQEPPLKPEARKVYDQDRAARRAGQLDFDPAAKCISPGVPRIMFLPYAMELIQGPRELTMLFDWNHQHRHINLTGQSRALEPLGRYMGISSGRWDGDTLVVDTRNLKEEALLDAAGLPGSSELHVVERYTLQSNGKQLRDVMTIEDPSNYTHAWQTQVTYHRLSGESRIFEDVCLDRLGNGTPAIAGLSKSEEK